MTEPNIVGKGRRHAASTSRPPMSGQAETAQTFCRNQKPRTRAKTIRHPPPPDRLRPRTHPLTDQESVTGRRGAPRRRFLQILPSPHQTRRGCVDLPADRVGGAAFRPHTGSVRDHAFGLAGTGTGTRPHKSSQLGCRWSKLRHSVPMRRSLRDVELSRVQPDRVARIALLRHARKSAGSCDRLVDAGATDRRPRAVVEDVDALCLHGRFSYVAA